MEVGCGGQARRLRSGKACSGWVGVDVDVHGGCGGHARRSGEEVEQELNARDKSQHGLYVKVVHGSCMRARPTAGGRSGCVQRSGEEIM
jgi:hypothetical protein